MSIPISKNRVDTVRDAINSKPIIITQRVGDSEFLDALGVPSLAIQELNGDIGSLQGSTLVAVITEPDPDVAYSLAENLSTTVRSIKLIDLPIGGFSAWRNGGADLTELKQRVLDAPDFVIDAPSGIDQRTAFLRTPYLSRTVYSALRAVLSRAALTFPDDRERDVYVSAAISVMSGMLPNVRGLYGNRFYHPHLYSFILAPAASGKGSMKHAYEIGEAVHRRFKEEYEVAKALSDQHQKLNPKDHAESEGDGPLRKRLFLPGNSSASALIEAIDNSGGSCILFETEADTVSQTLGKEWGNFSDVLRKAHAHEMVTQLRKTGEHEVMNPCLATVLSGTPNQLSTLIPDVENGLFSRFNFYCFIPEDQFEWRSMKPGTGPVLPAELFRAVGAEATVIYDDLVQRNQPLEFELTDQQWERHDCAFAPLKQFLTEHYGDAGASSANRCGLHVFRLAMTIAVWQAYRSGIDLQKSDAIRATDATFEAALSLGHTYAQHTLALLSTLPPRDLPHMPMRQREFLSSLPDEFERKEADSIAKDLQIPLDTMHKWLSKWIDKRILERVATGCYSKL